MFVLKSQLLLNLHNLKFLWDFEKQTKLDQFQLDLVWDRYTLESFLTSQCKQVKAYFEQIMLQIMLHFGTHSPGKSKQITKNRAVCKKCLQEPCQPKLFQEDIVVLANQS